MKPCRAILYLVSTLVIATVAFMPASAQHAPASREGVRVVDSSKIQIITIRDGSSLVGRIVAVRSDSVDFQMGAGHMTIASSDIREVKVADADRMHDGQYWFPNPNTTRLFFAPSGQMLKKGEGYFADYELFFPGFAYGVTDNFSVGGGMSLFPVGFEDQVYYFTPKVGASFGQQIHVAAGFLLAGTSEGSGGIGYAVGTFGDGDGSISAGVGWGFAGGDIESKPVAMLGGEKRVTRRVALVTENYLLPISEDNVLYSFGVRLMGEKLTTDLALFNVTGSEVIGFPYVDFVFRF